VSAVFRPAAPGEVGEAVETVRVVAGQPDRIQYFGDPFPGLLPVERRSARLVVFGDFGGGERPRVGGDMPDTEGGSEMRGPCSTVVPRLFVLVSVPATTL